MLGPEREASSALAMMGQALRSIQQKCKAALRCDRQRRYQVASVCLVSNKGFFLQIAEKEKHKCRIISKLYFQLCSGLVCLLKRGKNNNIRYQERYFRHIVNLCSLQHAVTFQQCSNSIKLKQHEQLFKCEGMIAAILSHYALNHTLVKLI